MEIDHVVLAARSKAEAERVLAEAGLGIARGRAIPGLGVSNLVVPLRQGQLLEIHYPNGEPPAPDAPPLLRFHLEALDANPRASMTAMAWLLAYEDERRLRGLAAANGMSVIEAPAEGPGFPPYLLAGFGANFERRHLPCLIHWPEGFPSLSAEHRRRPVGITRIDVAGPADEIEAWCGGAPNGWRALPGSGGPLRVAIGFEDGEPVTLGLPG
ncbi:VOC family protein [Glycomyces sp. TRM65418]|uniref:VOC family protein n=1 Tax=Glycomyces sp. TRM65418 TaxID=2867006 RepID=UPI001CE5EEB2|nr:VOC family protein [Glycomyces sp. TRM65418]MCC3761816.1 VOC family protein [Glycomyces sp. TRM65418]QZD55899.1 VOC family protein [Glycomyces sp. TRM65418]